MAWYLSRCTLPRAYRSTRCLWTRPQPILNPRRLDKVPLSIRSVVSVRIIRPDSERVALRKQMHSGQIYQHGRSGSPAHPSVLQ
jgi:hypothetical protein